MDDSLYIPLGLQMSAGGRWVVARVHPGAGELARLNLRRQEFLYYNPRFNERVRRSNGSVTWKRAPLFPNYLLVNNPSGRYRPLESTVGLAGVIPAPGGGPAFISQDFVDALHAREDENGLVVLKRSRFGLGSRVEFKKGPFAFQVGKFAGQGVRDRVYVLLNMMLGTERRVETTEANLVAV